MGLGRGSGTGQPVWHTRSRGWPQPPTPLLSPSPETARLASHLRKALGAAAGRARWARGLAT